MKTPHGSPSKRVLSCQHCAKEFKHKFDLRIHEAVHTGEKPLICDSCGAGFALKARLRHHLKSHKTYKCSLDGCSFTCDKWTQLRKHVSEHHKKKCPSCTKKFTNIESLEKHIAAHSSLLKCPSCDLTYSKKSNLVTHVRSVHERVTYKCSFEGCNSELLHRKSLRNHMKNHLKNNEKKHLKNNEKSGAIIAESSNHTESGAIIAKPSKKLVTKRNVVMAELVTGETAGDQERQEILHQDKKFRSEFTEFQNEVRIC